MAYAPSRSYTPKRSRKRNWRARPANRNAPPLRPTYGGRSNIPRARSRPRFVPYAASRGAKWGAMARTLKAVLAATDTAPPAFPPRWYRRNGSKDQAYAYLSQRVDPNFPSPVTVFNTSFQWRDINPNLSRYLGVYPYFTAVPRSATTSYVSLEHVFPPGTRIPYAPLPVVQPVGQATATWADPSEDPAPVRPLPVRRAPIAPHAYAVGFTDARPLPVVNPVDRPPRHVSERKMTGRGAAAAVAVFQAAESFGDAMDLWEVAYDARREFLRKRGVYMAPWSRADWAARARGAADAFVDGFDYATAAKGVASWAAWEVVGSRIKTAYALGGPSKPGNVYTSYW